MRDVYTSTNFLQPPHRRRLSFQPSSDSASPSLFASSARRSLHPGFRVLTPAPPPLLVNRDHRQRPGRDISQAQSPRLLPARTTRLAASTATVRAMENDFKDRLLARLMSSSAQQ